jgi:hypothetical protein
VRQNVGVNSIRRSRRDSVSSRRSRFEIKENLATTDVGTPKRVFWRQRQTGVSS